MRGGAGAEMGPDKTPGRHVLAELGPSAETPGHTKVHQGQLQRHRGTTAHRNVMTE